MGLGAALAGAHIRPVGPSKGCWSCDSIQNDPRAPGTLLIKTLLLLPLSQPQHDGSWIQLDPLHCSQTFLVSLTMLTLQEKGPFPPLLT